MSRKNLLERIRLLGSLTPSEAKIVAFFEDNFPLAAFETISSVSQKAGVGKATVGRFLNRLGYQGFTEFMADIRQDVVDRLVSPIDRYTGRREEMAAAGDDFLAQHVGYTMKNLEETLARNKPELINQAAKLMAGGKGDLYVMGAATSQALAHFFYLLAKYMRKRVYLLDANMSTIRHQLIDVCKDDVLLAITHYRFSTYTVKVATWFHKLGCPLILLADKEVTPLSDVADIQLYARSAGPPLFNSRVSALLVLETLLMAMAPMLEDKMYQRFQVFEDLRDDFGTFTNWPGKVVTPGAHHEAMGKTGGDEGKKPK
jgi:DNA-binding MurR/RpiR family transcriptional regulator